MFTPRNKHSQICRDAVKVLSRESVIAMDSEGVNLSKDGPLTLLQIGTLSGSVYLFDVMLSEDKQDSAFFKETGLDQILTSDDIVKVIQSCSHDSAALFHQFGIKLRQVFDTQVAHLVIEEHKGRLLPSQKKLAEICERYSKHATVYEAKEELKSKWSKKVGNFWARRPMTEEMIQYASSDVTALIPEVYENQKKYLEKYNLLERFYDRVQEEINYFNDPVFRDGRLKRTLERRTAVLNRIASTYQQGVSYESIIDDDEKKAIEGIPLREINAFPKVIQDLKNEELKQYLSQIEEGLVNPDTFNPPGKITFILSDIERLGTVDLKSKAIRVKRQVRDMVIKDIERKYKETTPVKILTGVERYFLRGLRLLDDAPKCGEVAIALHWAGAYDDLCNQMVEYRTRKLQANDGLIRKLNFLAKNSVVPQYVKIKAKEFLSMIL